MCHAKEDYGMYDPCHCCKDNNKKIERVIEYVEDIVKQLYINEKVDCARLEDNIASLCYSLDIKEPIGIINLYRHNDKISKIEPRFSCEDLIEENQTYLKLLRR